MRADDFYDAEGYYADVLPCAWRRYVGLTDPGPEVDERFKRNPQRVEGYPAVAPVPPPTRTTAEDLALCGCGHTVARHTVACWSCDCGRTEGELLAQLRRERAA